MFQLFHEVKIDWLGKRRFFIGLSIALLLAGMGTALYRHKFHPNGTDAFNLGVDFKGGTVVTRRLMQSTKVEALRASVEKMGISDAVIKTVLSRPGEFLIRVPQQAAVQADPNQTQVGVVPGRGRLGLAL